MSRGRQNLAALSATSSTARVLNLATIFHLHGHTGEYASNPLFRNKRLNRAILLKHTLRSHERWLLNGRSTATKVVLPFDTGDLSLGGYSVFVGEKGFEANIRNFLETEGGNAELPADIAVLKAMDELPSFDPFLLRERLRRAGHNPARCYFDLTDSDTQRMHKFVESEIRKLVQLAFADDANVDMLSTRMAELLMKDETAARLAPLRATLQLSGEEYVEGIFAWKGFLYYSWLVRDFAEGLPELSRSILSLQILRASYETRNQINSDRRKILACLSSASGRVRSGLALYRDAYAKLAAGEPAAFRNFLLRAPFMFLTVGEAISVIKHIDSYWRFRFGTKRTNLTMDVDEAVDVFGEFAGQLAGFDVSSPFGSDSQTFV